MKEFTKNEALEMMYNNTANSLNLIADHIEQFKMDWQDVVVFLREAADELSAQNVVVNLRDALNNQNKKS
jgi:hypothetical protein